jgi:RNA polymerase sigma-B factor
MPATLPGTATVDGTEFDDLAAALFARMTGCRTEADRSRVRAEMIETGLPLAVRLARHYQGRGEPFEDLVQVATVGLIKAIDGYDAQRGPFSHYAGPTVRGELKKHFRDRGWSVRVPRRLQELKLDMSRAHEVLVHRLGRAPTVTDLAGYLHVDEDQIIEGMDLSHAYQPVSLDAPVSAQADAADLGEMLGARDPAVESVDDRMTLATLLPHLPEREQRILHLRFFGNMTQSQIATEIGISQMHVSRLLGQALAWLREAMTGDTTPAWPGPSGAAGAEPGGLRLALHRLPGGTVRVEVAGEIDADNADRLRTALCESALTDRPCRVQVDLSRVPFVDAAGLSALVAGRGSAQRAGAEFRLERCRTTVLEVLSRAGVAEVLLGRPRTQPVVSRRPAASVAHTTLPV